MRFVTFAVIVTFVNDGILVVQVASCLMFECGYIVMIASSGDTSRTKVYWFVFI